VTPRFPVAVARCALTTLLALAAAAPAIAAPGSRDGDPDRVVVAFDQGADGTDRDQALRDVDAIAARTLPALGGTTAVSVADGHAASAAAELNASDGVAWAQVDTRVRTAMGLPAGDFARGLWQWGLSNLGQLIGSDGVAGVAGVDGRFPAAWGVSTGAARTPIAVIDTGVDFSIADLEANRVAGGHDFVDSDEDPAPAPPARTNPEATSHGTHVAGIAAAALAVNQQAGDITGGAPDAGIMALRALNAAGTGWSSDIAAAFAWAADHGARVVNASLSSVGPSQAMADAVAAHPNTLFVVAAGNGGHDEDARPAAQRDYPCALDLANVICVAAVDNHGALAGFSNYGAASVDVAAPGVDIVSYTAGGHLAWWDGTSMASPYVAAAAELALAQTPTVTAPQLHDAIIESARLLSGLAPRITSGGMIDADALLATTAALPVEPAPVAPAPRVPAAVSSPTPDPPTPPAVPAPGVAPPPASAAPRTPMRRSPSLKIERVSRSGSLLRVSGTLARAWQGTVTVSVCTGRRCTHVRARVRHSRFTVRSAVRGRRIEITVAAPATRGYRAARVTRAARS
jgi:thermitase